MIRHPRRGARHAVLRLPFPVVLRLGRRQQGAQEGVVDGSFGAATVTEAATVVALARPTQQSLPRVPSQLQEIPR